MCCVLQPLQRPAVADSALLPWCAPLYLRDDSSSRGERELFATDTRHQRYDCDFSDAASGSRMLHQTRPVLTSVRGGSEGGACYQATARLTPPPPLMSRAWGDLQGDFPAERQGDLPLTESRRPPLLPPPVERYHECEGVRV